MSIKIILLNVIFFLTVNQNSCKDASLIIRIQQENGLLIEKDLIEFIEEGKQKIKSHYDLSTSQLQEKVISVQGLTGTGKSTLINYLNDVPMVFKYEKKYVIKPLNYSLPGFEIGHNSESKTIYPTVYTPPGGQISFVDNPGFHENRGVEYSIANGFFRKEILDHAKEFKFLLLIPQSDIESRGNDFRKSINAVSAFIGIFDDSDETNKIQFYVETLAKSIGIIVTKVDNEDETDENDENIKKYFIQTLNEIIEQEKDIKISNKKSTEIEDVFKQVLENEQLEIFPGSSNVKKNNRLLGSVQKERIMNMIDQKLSFISKDQANLRVKLDDKVNDLKYYIDKQYKQFELDLEKKIAQKLNESATNEINDFNANKISESIIKAIENYKTILSIISNENATFSNIELVLVNFTKINNNFGDFDQLKYKSNILKYLIDILPQQDVVNYLATKILESNLLSQTINNIIFELHQKLVDTILDEREQFIDYFQNLLLNKLNERALKEENDFMNKKHSEPGKVIQDTIDKYEQYLSLLFSQNLMIKICDQLITNLTNIKLINLGENEKTEFNKRFNSLKILIPASNESYLETSAFNKTTVIFQVQNISSKFTKKLNDAILFEKDRVEKNFTSLLLRKFESSYNNTLNCFDSNGYLNRENMLNNIICDFRKIKSILETENFTLYTVYSHFQNFSILNKNIFTSRDLFKIQVDLNILKGLKYNASESLLDQGKSIIEIIYIIQKLDEYLAKYKENCTIYKRLSFYKQYPTAFIILESKCNIYRTLGVDCDNNIYSYESTNFEEAFQKRSKCRDSAIIERNNYNVSSSLSDIESVIDKYNNSKWLTDRFFPNSILTKCGFREQIENGLLFQEGFNNGCCKHIHYSFGKCCCFDSNSHQVSSQYNDGKNCLYKMYCDEYGWLC